MNPVEFPFVNCRLAEEQDEYQTLPVFKDSGPDGIVVSCWKLSWWERFYLLFVGRFWIMQMTFGRGFPPILPECKCPIKENKDGESNSSS
jgi:hypothetical protein